MRAFCLGCLIFGAGLIPCAAGEGTLDPDEAIRLGRQWLEANVDTNVLDSLGLDLDAVEELARDIQRQFNSEYVLDLAELQDTARAWLPQLEQNEATRPYAAWLRSHTDYFDVARQLKEAAPTNVARWNPTWLL